MKLKDKIKLIIFDVDGVLINSKKNMNLAFNAMCKKNNLKNLRFIDYFNMIGLPFIKIMKNIGITDNLAKLKKDYFYYSLAFKKKIKPYNGVYQTLKTLEKNYILAIVTSKAKKNTNNFINFFFPKIKFKLICSPNNKLRSKPYPDMLVYVSKKTKIKPSNAIYLGDTYFDYKASKSSKMKFILAKYGYFANDRRIKTDYKIKKFSDIIKVLKND